MTIKTYVAIIRDHSASMRGLSQTAMKDFNTQMLGIKESVLDQNQEAFYTVVSCGIGPSAKAELTVNKENIKNFTEIHDYSASGGATPLWDSIGLAIQNIEDVYDKNDPNVAFLLMAITDGQENSSRQWNAPRIKSKILELNETGKWTISIRVPYGSRSTMENVGIPAGNIVEWEQTTHDLERVSLQTNQATRSYFAARSSGTTSVATFYADVKNVNTNDPNLMNVTTGVLRQKVPQYQDGIDIKTFCVEKFGSYRVGAALYELVKRETVQPSKKIAIVDTTTGNVYTGDVARKIISIPSSGDIKLAPSYNQGKYKVFVQSTSVNRKLPGGTEILYVA